MPTHFKCYYRSDVFAIEKAGTMPFEWIGASGWPKI